MDRQSLPKRHRPRTEEHLVDIMVHPTVTNFTAFFCFFAESVVSSGNQLFLLLCSAAGVATLAIAIISIYLYCRDMKRKIGTVKGYFCNFMVNFMMLHYVTYNCIITNYSCHLFIDYVYSHRIA